jgi:hypothetical protein
VNYYGYGLNPALVGRTLANVEVSPDRERLALRFADGTSSYYDAEGDCCSQSWIEHLTVPPDISGAVITGLTEGGYIDGQEATPEQRAESAAHREWMDVLLVYQTSIQTDRGEVVIEYRNDSNGYYGGMLRERSA